MMLICIIKYGCLYSVGHAAKNHIYTKITVCLVSKAMPHVSKVVDFIFLGQVHFRKPLLFKEYLHFSNEYVER